MIPQTNAEFSPWYGQWLSLWLDHIFRSCKTHNNSLLLTQLYRYLLHIKQQYVRIELKLRETRFLNIVFFRYMYLFIDNDV